MPIYEYQCQACAHRFEKLQKVSAEPLLDCPACAAPALQKLLSLPGFRLGGQGGTKLILKPAIRRIWPPATALRLALPVVVAPALAPRKTEGPYV